MRGGGGHRKFNTLISITALGIILCFLKNFSQVLYEHLGIVIYALIMFMFGYLVGEDVKKATSLKTVDIVMIFVAFLIIYCIHKLAKINGNIPVIVSVLYTILGQLLAIPLTVLLSCFFASLKKLCPHEKMNSIFASIGAVSLESYLYNEYLVEIYMQHLKITGTPQKSFSSCLFYIFVIACMGLAVAFLTAKFIKMFEQNLI